MNLDEITIIKAKLSKSVYKSTFGDANKFCSFQRYEMLDYIQFVRINFIHARVVPIPRSSTLSLFVNMFCVQLHCA